MIRKHNFITFFLKLYLFWLLFFTLNRFIFFAYNFSLFKGIGFVETAKAFFLSWPLDHSTASYFIGFPLFFGIAYELSKLSFLKQLIRWFTMLLALLVSILCAAELPIYDDWGVKLNYKALTFLQHPDEVWKTATLTNLFLGFALIVLQFGLAWFAYHKWIHNVKQAKLKWYTSTLFFLLFLFTIGTGVRGGLQPIPINQSDVYYSKHDILNTTAVNSSWNLIHSIIQNSKNLNENGYDLYTKAEIAEILKPIASNKSDSTVKIFNNDSLNLVIIILESWSADMVEGIDGYFKGVTPVYDSLADSGILFTNCIGSGFRSDQGIAAIFSGFHAQPQTSIIKQPSKFKRLPSMVKGFKEQGYYTSFHFGGQLSYGNIEAYMYYNGFDEIITEDDFGSDIPAGRLAVHDPYLFERHIQDLNSYPEPFLAGIFTQSSHSPFDHPKVLPHIEIEGKDEAYVNSVHYSDWALKKYFAEASKQDWFDRTVFVLVGDHSHSSPKRWKRNTVEYKKIPMLIYGKPLKNAFRGIKFEEHCTQTDIPKTLLKQWQMDATAYPWSKDLFQVNQKHFGFHTFDNGMGVINSDGAISYDYTRKKVIQEIGDNKAKNDSLMQFGQAYLQKLVEEYLAY